ncbi:MAG: hypothetical protein ABEI78_01030 [Candidatus Nanohaloarchaea archaeon]
MLDLIRNKDINQIYAYEMLQKFAFSLIGIFIPIYIASLNKPVQWVFMYIIAGSSSFLISSFPVSYIISKIGFKHSLLASYIFYLPAFIVLRVLTPTFNLIIMVAIFLGIGKAFHWISLHSEFALDSEESKRSEESSKLIGLPKISWPDTVSIY